MIKKYIIVIISAAIVTVFFNTSFSSDYFDIENFKEVNGIFEYNWGDTVSNMKDAHFSSEDRAAVVKNLKRKVVGLESDVVKLYFYNKKFYKFEIIKKTKYNHWVNPFNGCSAYTKYFNERFNAYGVYNNQSQNYSVRSSNVTAQVGGYRTDKYDACYITVYNNKLNERVLLGKMIHKDSF